jgi:hypothetical protein
MDGKASPVYARRLRLSTGAISAALFLTGAAALTVFEVVNVQSSAIEPSATVPVQGLVVPVSAMQMNTDHKHASSDDARLGAVRQ